MPHDCCAQADGSLVAVLVLGGDNPHSFGRSRAALAYYRSYPAARLIVSGGARVVYREAAAACLPPPVSEAEHMARWLLDAGVHPAHVWQETQARDTLGNIVLGVALAQSRGISARQVVLVSDDFHLPRCCWLFARVCGHGPLAAIGSGTHAPMWLRWREPLAQMVQRWVLARARIHSGDVAGFQRWVLGYRAA